MELRNRTEGKENKCHLVERGNKRRRAGERGGRTISALGPRNLTAISANRCQSPSHTRNVHDGSIHSMDGKQQTSSLVLTSSLNYSPNGKFTKPSSLSARTFRFKILKKGREERMLRVSQVTLVCLQEVTAKATMVVFFFFFFHSLISAAVNSFTCLKQRARGLPWNQRGNIFSRYFQSLSQETAFLAQAEKLCSNRGEP